MDLPSVPQEQLLTKLFTRLQEEGVRYVLVGGQAVRLNGYLRATEDVDLLLEPTKDNGERVIRALDFLTSSIELDSNWFVQTNQEEVENIRVADELLIDLLFAANGRTLEQLKGHIVELQLQGVTVNVLDIDGLLATKTDYREKDILDKAVLRRLKDSLT